MSDNRESAANETPRCYHCGDVCDTEIIHAHEKTFCCEGCKMVFELLDDNDLCTYYDLEKNPGIKMRGSLGDKFAYLDNEEIESSLLDFNDGDLKKIKFYIPQIHCSSCIWLLENMYRMRDGIVQSQVNFIKKEAYVTYRSDQVSLRELVELMTSIGYEPAISLQSGTKEAKKKVDRALYYKLGIAGFAFGNIMLLSFPEYLDVQDFLEDQYKRLFGYLNLVLSLPVFFYSASDYFVSAFKGLRAKYVNIDVPVSIGIIALYSRSSYEILSETGPGFMDSFAMFVFLLLVGKWYQNRTYQALSFDRDYKSYFPIAVTKLNDGVEHNVALNSIDVNDIILVRNGEIIPADSTLLSNEAQIDYSFVTGESDAVSKRASDKIFAGGRQVGTSIKLRVDKAVSQSYLTRLWNQDTFQREKTTMNRLIDRVSQNFTFMVLILAMGAMAFWWYQSGMSESIHVFTSVLIIACPCALALTVPFTFGNSLRIFGKLGFYLKNTDTIERMAQVDTLVFDKTGTLTQSVADEVDFHGTTLNPTELQLIKSLVKQSAHPVSTALYRYISGAVVGVDSFKEVTGKGVVGEVHGHQLTIGSSKLLSKEIVSTGEKLASVAHIEIDGEYKGYFSLHKAYRNGLEDVLKQLGNKYELYLLSGDNEAEFENLRPYFSSDSHLQFNQTPEAKLNFIQSLQEKGNKVLMIGDGLNDAGALKQADVGISIADDVFQFSPACDAILRADKFDWLPKLLLYSGKAMRIVRSSFAISISYNSIGMLFALNGMVTPLFAAILMPISSVSVVSFVTIATNLSARSLGFNRNKLEKNQPIV